MVKDKITIEELKMFVGTDLKIEYAGVDPKHEGDGCFLTNKATVKKIGGLKVVKFTKENIYLGIGKSIMNYKSFVGTSQIIPIVRPLFQLTEEITHNGEQFIPAQVLLSHIKDPSFRYSATESLIWDYKNGAVSMQFALELASWHFDLFDWIGRGLAKEKTND